MDQTVEVKIRKRPTAREQYQEPSRYAAKPHRPVVYLDTGLCHQWLSPAPGSPAPAVSQGNLGIEGKLLAAGVLEVSPPSHIAGSARGRNIAGML